MPPVHDRHPLRTLDAVLERAERCIALLGRCRPLEASRERARLLSAARAGRAVEPRFRYAPAPAALPDCARALEAAARQAESHGDLGALYAARAEELLLEADLVAARGTVAMARLASRRYPEPTGDAARWCHATALAWAACRPASPRDAVRSDDPSHPWSLLRVIEAHVGRARLPVRVEITPHLDASAATGDGVIYVRAGVWHTPQAAERIALHEVAGHASPRVRARLEALGLFRVGTAESGEDEEGRALYLERRAGLMDDARRRDLGRRHLAARLVRGGGGWSDTVAQLLDLEASAEDAVDTAMRVLRGGGLAREIAYLPALRRVEDAFAADPSVEDLFARGRVSVRTATVMASCLAGASRAFPAGAGAKAWA
jgi:hypothetical protein